MKFLLSLSIIPLLLLTNVSVAEDLPLPIYEEESSTASVHEYNYPSVMGFPILALTADENNGSYDSDLIVVQRRANELCESLGHKEVGPMSKEDLKYEFIGKAYLNGKIVFAADKEKEKRFLVAPFIDTNAIFRVLRCAD